MSTKIQWTDETWNPIIGCTKISDGCKGCYAQIMANRLASMPKTCHDYGMVITHGKWNGRTELRTEVLEKPFTWKKPRMIFVVSMGDLFHESVPFEWIDQVMDMIFQCSQHTFQILTKRPEQMKKYFDAQTWDQMPNLWLGVTTENQEQANKRILALLDTPAAKRFVSIEPMLGRVSFRWARWHPLIGNTWHLDGMNKIDQVIVGGETGPGARPMDPIWVHQIRDQCIESKTPFFFKSWGGKDKANYLIEGKEWKGMPI